MLLRLAVFLIREQGSNILCQIQSHKFFKREWEETLEPHEQILEIITYWWPPSWPCTAISDSGLVKDNQTKIYIAAREYHIVNKI